MLSRKQANEVRRGLADPVKDGASEGAAFKGVAQPSRRAPVAIALAAVAVLVVALVTKQPAPAADTPTTRATAAQLPAEAVTSSEGPRVQPISSPTLWPPGRNPAVTPYPTLLAIPAEEGPTQLVPAGPTTARLTISLPDGWQKASDAMYVRSGGVAAASMSISA